MCGRVRSQGRVMTPGTVLEYQTLTGQVISGVWGLYGGDIYNARDDKLEGYWKQLKDSNRGIIELDSFFEKGVEFKNPDFSKLKLPVIYNQSKEFAIITVNPTLQVGNYHHRMPAILQNIDKWLREGKLETVNYLYQLITNR